MTLRINDIAPNFAANTTEGTIEFHNWIGTGYAVLFSHPKDFTPVCTTEFALVAQLVPAFAERNTKVIGISVDAVDQHHAWVKDIATVAGTHVSFPIIDDTDMTVAKLYDMLPADTVLPDGRTPAHTATVRSVFIVGPDHKIKLTMTYPMTVGRNFDEILRALDAIQLTDDVPLATPGNWAQGDPVIVALSVDIETAQQRFGEVDIKLPYLRFVNAPTKSI